MRSASTMWWPSAGAIDTRQTGLSRAVGEGRQSRTSRQSALDASPEISSIGPAFFSRSLRCVDAVGDRWPKTLDTQQVAGSPPSAAVRDARGHALGQMGGADDTSALEPMASAMAAAACVVEQAANGERGLGLGRRQHLEGDVGEHGQRAPRAGHHLGQVVAGDVLDDAAARLERLAAAGNGMDAEDVVARRARLQPARAGEVGGEHAADGAPARLAAEKRQRSPSARRQAAGRFRQAAPRSRRAACRPAPTAPVRPARRA